MDVLTFLLLSALDYVVSAVVASDA